MPVLEGEAGCEVADAARVSPAGAAVEVGCGDSEPLSPAASATSAALAALAALAASAASALVEWSAATPKSARAGSAEGAEPGEVAATLAAASSASAAAAAAAVGATLTCTQRAQARSQRAPSRSMSACTEGGAWMPACAPMRASPSRTDTTLTSCRGESQAHALRDGELTQAHASPRERTRAPCRAVPCHAECHPP